MTTLSSQGIAKATTINAIARVLTGALKLVVTILIAQQFGAGLVVDAYMIAQSLPLLFLVMGEAVFITSFLPVFTKYLVSRQEKKAWLLADSLFSFSFLCLTGIVILVVLFAPEVTAALAPGLPEETLHLASSLIRMMSPVIVLAGIVAICTSIFYSFQHFMVPAVASVVFPLGMIMSIVLWGGTLGVIAIPAGAVAGLAGQATILAVVLAKTKRWFSLRFDYGHPGFKETIRSIGPRLAGLAVGNVNMIVDRMFASTLGGGYVTALSYAERIVQLPVILFVNSLAKAAMPTLSEYGSDGRTGQMRSLFYKMVEALFFTMVPVSVVFVLFGGPVVDILLRRGAFDLRASGLTSFALVFYGIGLLPLSLGVLMSVFFYALNDSMTPVKGALLCFFVNIPLDAVLMRCLSQGGVALATSLVATVNAVFLFLLLDKRIGPVRLRGLFLAFARICAAACFMGIAMWMTWGFLRHAGVFESQAMLFGLVVCAGCLCYAGACYLLKVDAYRLILEKIIAFFLSNTGSD